MKGGAFTVGVRFGDGVRSVLLGLAALLLLAAAFALFRFETGGEVAALRSLLALGVFLVLAPVLLVKGLLAGLRAFRAGADKGAAAGGVLLNGALLAGEVVVGVLAWSTLHSGF